MLAKTVGASTVSQKTGSLYKTFLQGFIKKHRGLSYRLIQGIEQAYAKRS